MLDLFDVVSYDLCLRFSYNGDYLGMGFFNSDYNPRQFLVFFFFFCWLETRVGSYFWTRVFIFIIVLMDFSNLLVIAYGLSFG